MHEAKEAREGMKTVLNPTSCKEVSEDREDLGRSHRGIVRGLMITRLENNYRRVGTLL